MLDLPDKRFWYFFLPVFLIGVVFISAPYDSLLEKTVEPVLYVFTIILGVGLATLSIRDGYSLQHPSYTIETTPIRFWVDIIACIAFCGIGAWKLHKIIV